MGKPAPRPARSTYARLLLSPAALSPPICVPLATGVRALGFSSRPGLFDAYGGPRRAQALLDVAPQRRQSQFRRRSLVRPDLLQPVRRPSARRVWTRELASELAAGLTTGQGRQPTAARREAEAMAALKSHNANAPPCRAITDFETALMASDETRARRAIAPCPRPYRGRGSIRRRGIPSGIHETGAGKEARPFLRRACAVGNGTQCSTRTAVRLYGAVVIRYVVRL